MRKTVEISIKNAQNLRTNDIASFKTVLIYYMNMVILHNSFQFPGFVYGKLKNLPYQLV